MSDINFLLLGTLNELKWCPKHRKIKKSLIMPYIFHNFAEILQV
jgi:hypothetical protein